MENLCLLILMYPYQTGSFLISLVVFGSVALVAYGLYRLIMWRVCPGMKAGFRRILTFIAIFVALVFFTMLTCTLITQHQVNDKLGFNYATPDTPEGELFLITRVDEGKAMHQAGLRKGDEIRFWATQDLYKLLIRNQGRQVEIPVKRNGKALVIHLVVPELRMKVVRFSFYGFSL